MPNDNIIDNLSIQVVGEANKAESALSSVIGKLKELSTTLGGIRMPKLDVGLSRTSVTNLSNFSAALQSLDVNKLSTLSTIASGMSRLNLGITPTSVENLSSFARGLNSLDLSKLRQLSTINFSNLQSLTNAARSMSALNGQITVNTTAANKAGAAQKRLATATHSVRHATHGAHHTFSLANTALGKLFNSIKRIAFYRVIRSAIKAVTQGFSEGIENLYRWSQAWGTSFAPAMDQLKTAQTYLKNGFASMFSPLIEYAIPIIDRVIDKLVDMFNVIQELFARLTGAATWNKAIKYPVKYKDDLDDASKSAKKLQNILMDFDEINAINTPNDAARGSSAGLSDYGKMFELVQTGTGGALDLGKFAPFFEDLGALIDDLKDKGSRALKKIKELGSYVLSLDFEPLRLSLKKLWGTLSPILDYFIDNSNDMVLKPLSKFFIEEGLPTAIDAVSTAISSLWEIVEPILDSGILQDIIDKLSKVNDIVQKFTEFIDGLDFSKIGDALAKLWDEGLSPILDWFIDNAEWFNTNVLQPITQFLVEKGIPGAIDAITEALKAIKQAFEPFADGLKKFWEDNGEWIMEMLEEHTMTALGKIKEAFQKIGEWFEKKGDLIRDIFEDISVLAEYFSPLIKAIAGAIGTKVWDDFVTSILNTLDALEPVLEIVSGIFDILSVFATGDGEKVKQGLGKIGEGLFESLLFPIKAVLRAIADVMDALGEVFPSLKNAAHAIRVFIGDEIDEVDDKVKAHNDLLTYSNELIDEQGNYVSVTGKKITAAQDEINKKRAEEIQKAQELGVTNSDMAREMTEWYNYCEEQGLDPLTGAIIFTTEQAKALGVAVEGVGTSADTISDEPITTLDDAFKALVTDVENMSPAAKTAFTQSEEYMKNCKKWGIDPLTGAILDMERDVNGLPYKVETGFSSIKDYASDAADHVKKVFEDTLSNKNGSTIGTDFAKGFSDALQSALDRTNFSAAIDIKEVTYQTIVQYKKLVNLDYEGQKIEARGFASGGFPTPGSLFYAGEGGVPELMGTVGGRTAVAGGEEITGIREAIVDQGQREEGLLRQLISAVTNKDLTLVANSKTGRWVNQSLKAYAGVTG